MHINASKALEAAEALDLEVEGLTLDAVTTAYRTVAKTCHPDGGSYDAAKWARIGWAKDLLTNWINLRQAASTPPKGSGDCRACTGTGRVQTRRGLSVGPTMFCALCNGTGNAVRRDRDE